MAWCLECFVSGAGRQTACRAPTAEVTGLIEDPGQLLIIFVFIRWQAVVCCQAAPFLQNALLPPARCIFHWEL